MEKTAVQKLAGVLKILVTITFVCNLIVLPLVPVLVSVAGCQIPLPELLGNLTAEPPLPGDDWPYFSPGLQMFLVVVGAWTENFAFTFVLTLFLLFCGIWHRRNFVAGPPVLGTILTGRPFPGGERRQPPPGGGVLLFDRRRRAGPGGVGAVLLRFRRAPADL